MRAPYEVKTSKRVSITYDLWRGGQLSDFCRRMGQESRPFYRGKEEIFADAGGKGGKSLFILLCRWKRGNKSTPEINGIVKGRKKEKGGGTSTRRKKTPKRKRHTPRRGSFAARKNPRRTPGFGEG